MFQPKTYWRLFALLALLPMPSRAQTALQASVAALVGKASYRAGEAAFKPLHLHEALHEGDWVQLETQKSRLTLKVSDGTEIRLKGKTRIRFVALQKDKSGTGKKIQFALVWGKFWAKVAKLTTRESKFEVKAGGVICGVRGTTLGGEFDKDKSQGAFYNFEGHVYVDDGHGSRELPEGTHDDFSGGQLGGHDRNDQGDSSNLGGPGGDSNGSGDDLADLIQGLGTGNQDGGQQMLVDDGHLGVLLGFNVPEGGN